MSQEQSFFLQGECTENICGPKRTYSDDLHRPVYSTPPSSETSGIASLAVFGPFGSILGLVELGVGARCAWVAPGRGLPRPVMSTTGDLSTAAPAAPVAGGPRRQICTCLGPWGQIFPGSMIEAFLLVTSPMGCQLLKPGEDATGVPLKSLK